MDLEECDIGIVKEGCERCKAAKGWKCEEGECSVINGDGYIVEGHEECDDGNLLNYDGCSSSMTLEDGFECANSNENIPAT